MKGQVILVLILVITVALAIGLSVIQRSLVDVSTATKVEQSARAFSAAEAGIERVLQGGPATVNFPEVGAQATVLDISLPLVPAAGSNKQVALEYPPLSKEGVAHVWLADFTSTLNPPPEHYKQINLDVYWGAQNITSAAEKPAIEIKVIYYTAASGYRVKPYYLDSNSSRISSNNFTDASSACTNHTVNTINGDNRPFLCKSTLTGLEPQLMLLRARILYSSQSQPFAVGAVGTCGRDCSLPPQARILTSTGTSGETQRKVQVFRLDKVVPAYFDYAIFSAGEIKKTP